MLIKFHGVLIKNVFQNHFGCFFLNQTFLCTFLNLWNFFLVVFLKTANFDYSLKCHKHLCCFVWRHTKYHKSNSKKQTNLSSINQRWYKSYIKYIFLIVLPLFNKNREKFMTNTKNNATKRWQNFYILLTPEGGPPDEDLPGQGQRWGSRSRVNFNPKIRQGE